MLHSIYIGHLSPVVTEEELCRLFGACGNVQEIYLSNIKPGQEYRFAFVDYDNAGSADRSVQDFSGWPLGRYKLKVQRSTTTATSFISRQQRRYAQGYGDGRRRPDGRRVGGVGQNRGRRYPLENQQGATKSTPGAYTPRPLKYGIAADPEGEENLLTLKQQAYHQFRDLEKVKLLLHRVNEMDVERPNQFRQQQLHTDMPDFEELEKLAAHSKRVAEAKKKAAEAAAASSVTSPSAPRSHASSSSGYSSPRLSLSPPPPSTAPIAPPSYVWESDEEDEENLIPSTNTTPDMCAPPPVSRVQNQAADIPLMHLETGLKKLDINSNTHDTKFQMNGVNGTNGRSTTSSMNGVYVSPDRNTQEEPVVGAAAAAVVKTPPVLPLGRSQKIRMMFYQQ